MTVTDSCRHSLWGIVLNGRVHTESPVTATAALWNPSSEAYSNKIVKQNCWNELMMKLIPGFEEKPLWFSVVLGYDVFGSSKQY